MTSRDLLTKVAQREAPYDILNSIQGKESDEKPPLEIIRFLSEFKDTTPPTSSPSPSRKGNPIVSARVKLVACARKAQSFEALCEELRKLCLTLDLSTPDFALLKCALEFPDKDCRKGPSLMTALAIQAYHLSPSTTIPCKIFSKKLPEQLPAQTVLENIAKKETGYAFLSLVGQNPSIQPLIEALEFLKQFKAPEPEHKAPLESGPATQ